MVGGGDDSSALTTRYDIESVDWVTLTSTVFTGADVVSIVMEVIVSVKGGSVVGGTVTVCV